MKAYVLFGYARSPGMAGDWHALAVVRAESIENAARKFGCAVEDGHGEEGRFVRQKRQFIGRVVRAMIAAKALRGRKRRDALRERKADVLRRYDNFQLRRMPTLR
ncbi:MAG TPA: hypothetical protein VLC10_02585 [Patescibacteria group bacterium]|nr:hypothetical protein [Patescibacteria group bacterium]